MMITFNIILLLFLIIIEIDVFCNSISISSTSTSSSSLSSLLLLSTSSIVADGLDDNNDNNNNNNNNKGTEKSAAELKQDAKANAAKELLIKINNATTTDEVFILAEEIPAILRSVDKVMRIVIASETDAMLASHCIQKLASITAKSSNHGTKWIGERRFEQLTECIELKADKMKTSDLTRYLWGLTVLGIHEKDMIDFVYDEFYRRVNSMIKIENSGSDSLGLGLGTLSLEKDKIEDVATMLWSIGCVKDTFGWTNTTLAETLCSILRSYCSETLKMDNLSYDSKNPVSVGFSKRLFIRALWSLAVHNLLDQSLFSSGLAVIHAAKDDLSSTNVIILLWSCAQVKLVNKVGNEDKNRLIYLLQKLQNSFQLNQVNLADIALAADAMDSLYCVLVDRLENSSSSIEEKDLNRKLATLLKDTVSLMVSSSSPSFPHLSLSSVCSVMRVASRTCTCTPSLWNQALLRFENKNLTISKSDALNLLEAISCMPETTVVSNNMKDSKLGNDDEAMRIKSSGLLKIPRPGKRSQSVRWFKVAGRLSSIISSSDADKPMKTRHFIDAYWAINSLGLTHRNLILTIQLRLKDKSPKEIMLELTPRALSRLVRSMSILDHGLLSKPASYPSPIITKLDRIWTENVITATVSCINDIEPMIRRVATVVAIACMYPSTSFIQTIPLSITLDDMKLIPDRLLVEFMWASKILPMGTISPSVVVAILDELKSRVLNLRNQDLEGKIDHSKNDLHFFIQALKSESKHDLISQNLQEEPILMFSKLLINKWIQDNETGRSKIVGTTSVSSAAICSSGLSELLESCLENKWYQNEVLSLCETFIKKNEELLQENNTSIDQTLSSEEAYQYGRLEQLMYTYQEFLKAPEHQENKKGNFFSKILHLIPNT